MRPGTGCSLQGLEGAVGEAQHRDVGGWVAAGQGRSDRATVRQGKGYVVVGLERIAGRDHGVRLPDETAGHGPAMRSNAHHGAGCILDETAQRRGQGEQRIGWFRHRALLRGSRLPG